MNWTMTHRSHTPTRLIADRHYSRQKVGTAQFVPPGRCLVLLSVLSDAYWVTSWPYAEYVKHDWPGAWICSAFRNEGRWVASEMIRQALAVTRWRFGEPPEIGLVTFIDRDKVQPTRVRGKDVWGWTFLKAGFEVFGETKGGLLVLGIRPNEMPESESPAYRLNAG